MWNNPPPPKKKKKKKKNIVNSVPLLVEMSFKHNWVNLYVLLIIM